MKAAVCLIARDEERDIGEWLAFQFAVGFDAVIVYDNASTDRTPDIVRAFGRHFTTCGFKELAQRTDPLTQHAAYNDCLSRFGSEFDWIAFLDADELLVPRQGGVQELLEVQKSDATAVALNWRMLFRILRAPNPSTGAFDGGIHPQVVGRRRAGRDEMHRADWTADIDPWSAHYFLITEVSAAIARPAAGVSHSSFSRVHEDRGALRRVALPLLPRKLVLNGERKAGRRMLERHLPPATSKISTPTTATSLRTARRCGSYPRCMVSLDRALHAGHEFAPHSDPASWF